MSKVNNVEKAFLVVLIFLAGAAIGAIVYAILVPPRKVQDPCDSGRSTQVQNGVEYKTYIPALDNCK